MNHERVFKYIGIAAIVLLLFGLAGWYVFIRGQTASLGEADRARGFSIGIPSFLGSRGSTSANAGASSGAAAQEFGVGGSSAGSSAFLRLLGIGNNSAAVAGSPTTPGATAETTPEAQKKAPRFWRVSAAPVAGASFMSGTSTRLRYVERGTGYVFDVDAVTGDITRITNTLTPRVYEAYFGGSGLVLQRILEEGGAVTLSGKISTTTENGLAQLTSASLGAGIAEVATRPDSSDILMLSETQTGTHLIRAGWNGANAEKLLTIPAGEFHIEWLSGKNIVLAEKAASGVLGSAFRADGTLVPLLRNIPGLTVLAQASSSALLYSSDDGERLRFFVKTDAAPATELSVQTVADKCVWAPGTGLVAYCAVPQGNIGVQFVNRWYLGAEHTEDVWYTISAGSAAVTKLFTIDSGSAIDVESPMIDSKGEYLSFINARDKSLWILRISEN